MSSECIVTSTLPLVISLSLFVVETDNKDLLRACRTCRWWAVLEFNAVLDVILDRLFTNYNNHVRVFWSSALLTWLALAHWTVLCLLSFDPRLNSNSNVIFWMWPWVVCAFWTHRCLGNNVCKVNFTVVIFLVCASTSQQVSCSI